MSSIDSPRKRETQCNLSARSVDPNTTPTLNQTQQPVLDPIRDEAVGNINNDVMTVPSTHQQLNQVGTRFVDRETNTSEVEIRSLREETRIDNRDVQIPTFHSSIFSHETNIIRGSPIRPCVTDIMPQLDGPTSVCTRRRPEQEFVWRTTTMPRGGYPDESNSDSHNNMRPHKGRKPSRKEETLS